MVRALLEGRKTQTRRIINPQPTNRPIYATPETTLQCTNSQWMDADGVHPGIPMKCKQGEVGDRLWVKETFYCDHWFAGDYETTAKGFTLGATRGYCESEWKVHCYYRADIGEKSSVSAHIPECEGEGSWKPSIFMPRWASRINLEITAIRVEQLQEISEQDAAAEGVESPRTIDVAKSEIPWREKYRELWNSINLKPSPCYGRDESGKKVIVAYQCFPWSLEDFHDAYPAAAISQKYRGKPLTIVPNPWVWVIAFKKP